MNNRFVLNELEIRRTFKRLLNEGFPNLKTLMGLIGKNSDEFVKVFGDDAVKNVELLLTKVFSNKINIGVNKVGQQVIKGPAGGELRLESLSTILDGVVQGDLLIDDILVKLPKYLPDGSEFQGVLKKALTNKKNEVFHKSFEGRTIPVRFGQEYTSGLDEYNALINMYNANPQNIVKPINVVKDAKGNVIGYDLEKLQGKTLYDYVQNKKLTDEQFQKITDIIKGLHQKGLAHGDINPNNIMVLNDGNIKLIDPIGYPPKNNFPNFDKAVSDDLNKLERIKELGGL